MKKLLLLACASTLTSVAAFGTGCTINNNDADAGPDTGTGPTGDGGTDTAPLPDGATPDSGTPGDGSPGVDTGPSPDGGPSGPLSCSTGVLFAGNPLYDGEPTDRPTSGTGIHADPPLQWQNMVFTGTQVFTRDTGEIWASDLSVASPVETRIAGVNGADLAYQPGPCATARMAKIEGMAALSDKSLLVTDIFGNAVLHVTNPNTAACAVEVWAGNAAPNADLTEPFNAGDVDGVGTAAKLEGPGAIVTDDADNAYFFDRNNHKIKKVTGGATHTVTTVAKIATADGPDNITNLTRIGSTLYAIGTSGVYAYVLSIDTTTGAVAIVKKGGGGAGGFDPVPDSEFPSLTGITTDGTNLIISGKGYIWSLTTTGTLTHIAGNGNPIDFPSSGYDAKVSHPAKDVELPNRTVGSLIGSQDYVTYYAGSIYWRGRANGPASYVVKFSCP